MKMFARLLFAATLGLTLAGCGGESHSPATSGVACPDFLTTDSNAHLVSPAAGPVGVPDALTTVTFAYSEPMGALSGTLSLQPATGAPISVSASGTNDAAQATLTANLAPATEYIVTAKWNVPALAADGCLNYGANLGSFTTQ